MHMSQSCRFIKPKYDFFQTKKVRLFCSLFWHLTFLQFFERQRSDLEKRFALGNKKFETKKNCFRKLSVVLTVAFADCLGLCGNISFGENSGFFTEKLNLLIRGFSKVMFQHFEEFIRFFRSCFSSWAKLSKTTLEL